MYKKSIVRTKANLNLLQIKIWSWMFHKAFYYNWSKNLFSISLKELRQNVEFKGEDYQFKKTILSLMNCPINFYTYETNETVFETACILSYCQINEDLVTYHYNHLIESKINNKQMYKKLLMLIQNQFHSKYSRIIYGLCINNFDVNSGKGEFTVNLEQLRRYLELEEHEYPLFREINRTIIKKAAEEINDKSNLNINIGYIKNGKSIIAIKFFVTINSGNLLPLPETSHTEPEFQKHAPAKHESTKIDIANNQKLKDFFSKYKILPGLIEKKVGYLVEMGIPFEFIPEYIIFVKSIYDEKKAIITQDTFLNSFVQNKNIEKFLQKLAGEQMNKKEKHEEEIKEQVIRNEKYEEEMKELYKAQELVRVLDFFKEQREIFTKLLDQNRDKPIIRALRSELFLDELINSMAIAQVLLPQVKRLKEYNDISFEEWKTESLKVFT